MKRQSAHNFLSTALVIFTLLFSHPTSAMPAEEVEDEREFDYVAGSKKGPGHWGELKTGWAACKNGRMQSPIDMSHRRVKMIRKPDNLRRNYKPCNATVRNRGHDIEIEWEKYNAGSIRINGTEYHLLQCHWHSPSEHTIDGRRYDMELHMVHENADPNAKNKIAVIGVLYKIGHHPDPFLSKVLGDKISTTDQRLERHVGIVDPSQIKLGGKKHYRYMGSLTVPPCTEGVIWTINRKIRTVSRQQVNVLRDAVHDYAERNARPVQPLHQREIQIYSRNQGQTCN